MKNSSPSKQDGERSGWNCIGGKEASFIIIRYVCSPSLRRYLNTFQARVDLTALRSLKADYHQLR
jgi:hypothetical protein